VAVVDGDRQLALRFETREGRFELLHSILGPRSNVYLLDGERRLLLSLRPLAETRRDLSRGAPWSSPSTAPPPPGEDRFEAAPPAALLAAIEEHYAGLREGAGRSAIRRRLQQALRKRGDALRRKEQRLRADLEEAAGAAEARRMGELLKTALPSLPPRAAEVRVTDPESGEALTIPLDPALSPSANLERCFKRAKKAERKELRARQDLGAVLERREAHEALAAELEALEDEALEAFAARPEVTRLLERFAPGPPPVDAPEEKKKAFKLGSRELPTRLVPKRYRTADGLEIWVGKNDEGNDVLTTKLARGRDLFFHLEGSPGSHVVLRVEGPGEPPQASLLEAAELAVHFSKQKNAARAGVHVAAIKDVSKPRGAKPGLVYVHRGRTIQLRRDPARLERVLAARIED